jgi:hypothetical protein
MLPKGIAQRDRSTLVEQDAHLGRSQGALLRVLQDSAYLLESHAGEPLDELRCKCAVLEVFEKRCNWHSRTSKDPRSADAVWVPLDCGAGGPINHGRNASTAAPRRLTGKVPALIEHSSSSVSRTLDGQRSGDALVGGEFDLAPGRCRVEIACSHFGLAGHG